MFPQALYYRYRGFWGPLQFNEPGTKSSIQRGFIFVGFILPSPGLRNHLLLAPRRKFPIILISLVTKNKKINASFRMDFLPLPTLKGTEFYPHFF